MSKSIIVIISWDWLLERWDEMKWDELKMRLPYNITIKVVIIKKTQILRTYYIISHFIFHGFFSLKITRYIYILLPLIALKAPLLLPSLISLSFYLAAQGTLLYWQVLFYFLHFFLVVVVFFSFNANQSLSSFNSNKKREEIAKISNHQFRHHHYNRHHINIFKLLSRLELYLQSI